MNILDFNFDEPTQRQGTDSAKWHKYRDRDIIPLWVADMDFHSPAAVMEALHQRVDHGIFGYGVVQDDIRGAVTEYLRQSFGWHVDARWIIWLPGVVTGLNLSCRATNDRGREILTSIPVYPPFLSAHHYSESRLVTTPMVQTGNGWQIDFDELKRRISADTALFMLCNPHNPTGRVFDRGELMRLSRICLEHGVAICTDEIHCDMILDPDCRHIPIASLDDEIARNTITLMAPSKTYNIPGLGCSFAIVPNDRLRRRFKNTMAGIVPHVNIMGLVATQAAYRKGHAWLEAVKTYLRDNHRLVFETVKAIDGLTMSPAQATFLAWIDARGLNSADPARFFEQAGVGLSNGSDFKGSGFVRLNFGCPRPLLSRALERMKAAVAANI